MVKYADLEEMAKAWAEEFSNALNSSETYAEVAAGWGVDFDGSMLFVFEASGEIEEDIGAFLDLKDGKSLGITVLPPGEDPPRPPTLTIRAPMYNWKKVIFKELDAVGAIMQGKLALTGDLTLVMRYTRAAVELVNVAEQTNTAMFTQFDLGG